jgi:transposase
MSKDKNYCGIDVSKDKLDVFNEQAGHGVIENNLKGFRELLKWTPSKSHFVMEATGVYHKKLAHFIHNRACQVSVVIPLIIKRFSKMLLRSTKTDKADAQMIYKYAVQNPPALWEPAPAYIDACLDLSGLLNLLFKQRIALKNKAHALKTKGCSEKVVFRCIKQSINNLNRQIEHMEEQMEMYIEENAPELFMQLKSIPGIGTKTAAFLIVITDGFKIF